VANLLFLEEHIAPILDDLRAVRDRVDGMIGVIADGEIIKLTNKTRKHLIAKFKKQFATFRTFADKNLRAARNTTADLEGILDGVGWSSPGGKLVGRTEEGGSVSNTCSASPASSAPWPS